MNFLIPLVKIETMTSLEISELVGARHDNVKRSIDRLVESGVIQFPATEETKNFQGVAVKSYSLGKRDSYVVVAQISPEFTGRLVDRWQFLEDQLRILKDSKASKKHQLDAMEALSHLLPTQEPLNYIKANVVINKAVSNLFGFPKMLKKAEMSGDMLEVRERALDDYVKLFEVLEDGSKVKDILYSKYQPLRLESK